MSKSTQELFDEITKKIILPLEGNEIPCPTCKGLRFVYTQAGDKGLVNTCPSCFNGKHYVCSHCGMDGIADHCGCDKAQDARRITQDKIQSEKEQKLFNKAEKIKFADYEGRFILDGSDTIQDSDNIVDWLHDKIKYDNYTDEELPKYLWSTKAEPAITIDLDDIISSQCENDGYEDMYSYLSMDDVDLIKAQEYLNKWYKKQGDSINGYYENHKVAVLLDDLIKEIRGNIERENNDR